MDIFGKMEALKKRFEDTQEVIQQKQQEIVQLLDEQKRMQGEYRLLLELGAENEQDDEKTLVD